ncbi:MAG: sugar transferase, partial [Duncaniella sp.]|nr:sugar transferase [Duncaniella sp.]
YNAIMNDPLVDISCSELPDNVVAVKRFLDIVLSGTALILTLPVIAVLGAMIRFQSAGPAIFSQERIGYRKKPFRLYKLRSMYAHSEPDGPRLSSNHDERITPIGKVIRRYRLDELPNLWNVFKGDMSIVGPRPERQYYIDRIIEKAPHYTLIHQVRPGLTSWGMVRYGYASDVDGMVERLKYDMLYLQNMSLSLDIRILYYTIFTVMRGEGK